jgi:putative NIF3 family GTP cyclohydrolase 1 type 2
MKIQEIIDRVIAYHPEMPADYAGADGIKAGNPDQECTGIAVALVPTVEAIRKAAQLHCNLLFVHEPFNYTSPDEPGWNLDFQNHVFEEKQKLVSENGIVIFRDHDRMHAHQPDSIFTGVIRYLGWEEYYRPDDHSVPMGFVFELPEMSVRQLSEHLMEKLHLRGVRILGNPDDQVRRAAITGHLTADFGGIWGNDEKGVWHEYGTEVIRAMEEGVDVIIPLEIIEWTALSYVRDALALGCAKAVINIGHFAGEELGMAYAKDWLQEITGNEIPVYYVPAGDMYTYLMKEDVREGDAG